MYKDIKASDLESKTVADSSVVGITMFGLDARYSISGLHLRGQYYFTNLTNTSEYNWFTAEEGEPNDLGSQLTGYYIEAGYNVFRPLKKISTQLIPFVRYEVSDTHRSVEEGIVKNEAFHNTIVTAGLSWRMARGAVLKADMQFVKPGNADSFNQIFNAGFGVMF
jgi:hypothetical protein